MASRAWCACSARAGRLAAAEQREPRRARSAHAQTGQASYRVMHAATIAQPAARGAGEPVRVHPVSRQHDRQQARARSAAARSSACSAGRAGWGSASTAPRLPRRRPPTRSSRRRSAPAPTSATAMLATDKRDGADAPERYQPSTCTGSMFRTCGSGSQTAPICCQPGVRLSRMRRATTRCARAS